jgi:hypothetical protein
MRSRCIVSILYRRGEDVADRHVDRGRRGDSRALGIWLTLIALAVAVCRLRLKGGIIWLLFDKFGR